MVRVFVIAVLAGLMSLYCKPLHAQTDGLAADDAIVSVSDSIAPEDLEPSPLIVDALDSMTNCLFEGCFRFSDSTFMAEKYNFDTTLVPVHSDSEIVERMRYIPAVIPIEYNPYVKAYIDLYSQSRREQVRKMLGLSELYFPIFEEELDKRGMPMELKYLPIVESALNPHAVSRVGATGLWQIMYSTGKWLKLDIHTYLDERRDPYRSTEAAIDYLQNLYGMYGDWLLVIAAYNCGPGNVNKAIRRSGGKTTFWEIRNYLPRETRGYVPAFIGAMYVFHYHKEYNLQPIAAGFSFNNTDTVMIYEKVEIARIAEIIQADPMELIYLNPALKKNEIPHSKKGYPLVLPISKVYAFEEMRDSIFNPRTDVVVEGVADVPVYDPFEGKTKLTYTVKPGDNIGYIAEWYDCSPAMIREWNYMSGNLIRVGDKLTIYVPDGKADKFRKVEDMSFLEKQNKEYNNSSGGVKYIPSTKESTMLVYTVKSGDNLGFIAEWYDCSAQELRNWNGINGNTINVGDKLNVYVNADNVDKYKDINTLSFAEKQKREKGQSLSDMTNNSSTTNVNSDLDKECNCVYYEVKPGDTLWDISRKYPGTSIDDIKKHNNISDSRGIKPGMKLKIMM